MAERYLIDTSGAIKYLNGTFPISGLSFLDDVLDKRSIISFISKIELLAWNPPDPDDLYIYESFVSKSTIIGINDQIIHETIRVRKSYNLKLPDALIAATALINELILIADNDKDFTKITALKLINPNHLLA